MKPGWFPAGAGADGATVEVGAGEEAEILDEEAAEVVTAVLGAAGAA